jgi:hypothetical protein
MRRQAPPVIDTGWVRRPAFHVLVGLVLALALAGSYAGTTWYLARGGEDPVSAEPAPSPTPEAPRSIVIHGTGDVLLDPGQLALVQRSYDAPWDGVRDLFTGDDLTIINLECAPSELGEPEDKQFTFRCPFGMDEMTDAGVDVANLGNNHSGDFGPQALLDGRERLISAGLVPVGAGRNAAEANEPALFEIGGTTVAVLGFSGVVPRNDWIAKPHHPGVADGYSIDSMTRAVRAAVELADLVVVTIHWGVELATEPRDQDVARAHALIDAGADAIFGHHAHVLQPLEWYEGRPIFYGLGNFVWPRPGDTAVGRVVVSPSGEIAACLVPARITGGRPELLEGEPDC